MKLDGTLLVRDVVGCFEGWVGDEFRVDVDAGDVVDDDADFETLAVLKEVFEGCGFARAEEAGEEGDGDGTGGFGGGG